MKKICFVLLILPVQLIAQTDSLVSGEQWLNEVISTTSKFGDKKRNSAQSVEVVQQKTIELINPQNTADLLQQSGYVNVQKSQQGGGSPVIRGFEASRVLLVIDGIRINNAIYRAGHLQNLITVDPNSLERLEILYGPGSVLFGSDALGGVVQLITKNPKLRLDSSKPKATGNAFFRYGSVNDETTGHIDFNIGGKRFASFSSITFSRFGDLRSGSWGNGGKDSVWLQSQYVTRYNGVDSVRYNTNPLLIKNSGYMQWDMMQKFLFQQNESISHLINIQYSGSSDIPRNDRLSEVSGGKPTWAEWYYGPQTRVLAGYTLNIKSAGIIDAIQAGINYQYIEESRHSLRLNRTFLTRRNETVHVPAFYLHMQKKCGNEINLQWGIDGQFNLVKSTASDYNAIADTSRPASTRYPDGGNQMHHVGVFVQNKSNFIGEKIIFTQGIRYQFTLLESLLSDKSFFAFPFNEIKNRYHAVSGNLGLVTFPAKFLRLSGVFATGFRAPNIDDQSKIFESAPGTLFVPNPNLKPEYTLNGDLAVDLNIKKWLQVNLTGFYTYYLNAITADEYLFNGEDSVDFDGAKSKVFALTNKNRAFVTGASGSVRIEPVKGLVLESSLSYTYGRIFTDSVLYPLDHIQPLFGRTAISYSYKILQIQTFFLYNGAKPLKDYNLFGEDNLQYARLDGTPAWWTWNLKLSARITRYLGIDAGMDNILDAKYRQFSSGINGPGRNIYATLRLSF